MYCVPAKAFPPPSVTVLAVVSIKRSVPLLTTAGWISAPLKSVAATDPLPAGGEIDAGGVDTASWPR